MSLAFEARPTAEELAAGLVEIRRRRRLCWWLFGGFLPFCIVGTAVGRALFGTDRFLSILAVPYGLAFAAASFYAGDSRCPNCRKQFSVRGLYANPYTQRCLHCDQSLRA